MEIYNKVLEMLGVEEGEEFYCVVNDSKSIYKYKFKEGKFFQIVNHNYHTILEEGFVKLINGEWKIYRKTYKDDFLEKFPKCSFSKGENDSLCVDDVYGIGLKCSIYEYDCEKCWNQTMIDR